MKVLRSSLIVAAAVFTAACGDKVNVQGPTTPVAVVHSVTVAPATATLTNGASVTLTAAVTADAGATTTPIVWTSSSATATVTQGGVVTAAAAPAAGSVGICASVGGASGCATVLVTTAQAVGTTPAQLQIQSITGAGGLNCPVPVPPASVGTAAVGGACAAALNVGAQLDVRLNLTANSVAIDSVVVYVDGVSAGKQTFGAAQAASVISVRGGISAQITTTNLVISINIAACKTGAAATLNQQVTCGATTNSPSWANGTHTISAKAFGKFAGTSTASVSTAGQSVSLLFANLNGFIGTVTTTPATGNLGSVVDAAGFNWKSGTMTISAVPVVYSSDVPAFATFTFNNFVCSTGGAAVKSITIPAPASGPFVATFSLSTSGSQAAVSVASYELQPGLGGVCNGALLAAGEAPNVSAIGIDNNGLVLAAGGANGGAGFLNAVVNLNADPALSIRLDNVAPQLGTCLLNAITAPGTSASVVAFPAAYPDGAILVGNALAANIKTNNGVNAFTAITTARTKGWMNGATTTNGFASGTDRIVTSCPDLGSGRLFSTVNTSEETVETRVGLVTDANATIDATTPVTTLGGLAETGTGNAYRMRIRVRDKLGNARSSFTITDVYNDAAVALAGPHAILTGVVPGNFGTDISSAQVISAGGVFGVSVAAFDFGIDLTAPVLTIGNLAQISVPGGGGRFAVAPAPGTIYTALDNPNPATPAIPASGFFNLAGAPLWTSVNRRDVVNGNLFWCDAFGVGPAYLPAGSTCGTWITGTQNLGRVGGNIGLLTQPNDPSGTNVDAYYTQIAQVVDQAGNPSVATTNSLVLDATAPSIGGLSYPPFLTAGGAATFQSTTVDNLDIQSERMSLQYGAAGAAPAALFQASIFDANTVLAFAPTTAGAPFPGSLFYQADFTVNSFASGVVPATLITQHAMAFPVSGLITQWQMTGTANGTNGGALNANGQLIQANGAAVNQANTASGTSNTPVIAGALPCTGVIGGACAIAALTSGTVPMANSGAAGAGPTQFVICGVGAACVQNPLTLPVAATFVVSRDGVTAGNPTTVTINAVATGLLNQFTNPFSAVQFYAYDPTAGVTEGWRLIGTVANAAAVNDFQAGPPNGRNWTFSLTWDPSTITAPDNAAVYRIMAVGIGGLSLPVASQGVALASPIGSVTVTMTP